MSTIEKALVQIFERKNRIIDHVKQQILLFDQHLASKCFIDGFAPPPWLLTSSPSKLNKEDLISGLLLPHPQPSIPYSSLYQLPVVTTDNVQLPDFSCTQVDASNEGLDQCLSGKADELDPSVTSPPQDCRDGMISDVCPDPGLSLARIHRSKSRQRALEHRNSAKACKNLESSEKNGVSCNSEIKEYKIASLWSDPGDKLELIRSDDNIVSCAVEKEEIRQHWSKERSENVYAGRVTSSRNSVQPSKSASGPSGAGDTSCVAMQDGEKLELIRADGNVVSCAVEKEEMGQHWSKERSDNVYAGRVTRSRSSFQLSKSESGPSGAGNTSCVAKQYGEGLTASVCKSRQQPDVVYDLFKSKAVEPVHKTASCSVKNEESGQCGSKGRGENVNSGRITRSRSSAQPLKSVNDPPGADNRLSVAKQDGIVLTESTNKSRPQPEDAEELLQIVKPLDDVVTCVVAKEERGQCQSKQKGVNLYSGSIKTSRSSVRSPKSVNGLSCAGKTCNVAKEVGNLLIESFSKSKQQPNVAGEFLELVKSAVISDDSFGSSIARDLQSKEKENNVYQGRLTRSRSSSQQHNCMNKHLKLDSCTGWSIDDGISESMQLACHVNDIKKLIKPFDINDESCGIKAKISDFQTKESAVVDQSNNGNTRSRPNHSAKLFKLVDTSNTLKHEVTQSKSRGSNKFPYAKSSDKSEGDKLKEVSGPQVNSLRCANESDLAALNQFDAIVADTDANSNELVNAHSTSSGSNLDGAGNPTLAKSLNRHERSELDAIVTSLHSSPAMIVMPKQLDFDNLGECTLNEDSSLTLESEEEIESLEKRPLKSPPSADKLDEVTSVHYQEKYNLSLENHLLEEQEAFSKEEKQFKRDLNNTSGPGRTSNLNVVSSVKETPEASTDAVTNILPESNNTFALKIFMEGLSTTLKFAHDNMLGQSPKDASGSNLNADTETDYLFEKDSGKLEVVNSVASVSEASNRHTDVCSGTMILEDIDFTGVCSPDLRRKADATSCDAIEPPSPVVIEETKKQIVESSASQNQNADSIGRCTANGIGSVPDPAHAKSSEDKSAIQSIQLVRHSGFHVEGSWPHKRRKIDGQQSYSPSLSLSSKEEDVMQLNAEKSLVAEEDQNAGECNWEGRGRSENTPSTFMHKQFGVTSVSSLPQETLQNSKDYSAEGTEAVDPSSSTRKCSAEKNQILLNVGEKSEFINIEHLTCDETGKKGRTEAVDPSSSTRKCAADKSQILLTVGEKSEYGNIENLTCDETSKQERTEAVDPSGSTRKCAADKNHILSTVGEQSEFGNVEHLTCDEMSKQESKTQLREDGKFSAFPIRSPCRPPTDLISAGQANPEFEGFIMQTDRDQICIGGDEINFDQLHLPRNTVERVSLLEQLCKSACIHTPLSQFPTTYRLHRPTDLYQSVPNGLLECMDLRSTFTTNDDRKSQLKVSTSSFGEDTDHAFLGGYFSDCLPFSSSEVTGDVKKPYLSPVGKLWDRITLKSGSSEKRGSGNPELPCISEENENTDEVVDAFKEGSASKVVTCSVERKPLAEIRECPNVPASVSGAETFTVRDSLDSVNTAYSFTGTENGAKPKVGKHNASKRRDTNKMNGKKRASESLRNRFSKQKLSEKTSLRKAGPSFSQKESKVNNIVSNVTSFIPIVQQKQAAAITTGKRDVKVKALEAAEAAKRLAEKKENDRKMKKEALKLERARLEQENLRQLELEKKKKEEERKKKEADMAARKRQREEEERLEKERKRKRMDEARRQQRGPDEKLCAKKDEKEKKCQAPDESAQSLKVLNDEAVKHEKMQKEIAGANEGKMLDKESRTAVALTSDAVKASTAIENCNEKVMSTASKSTESDNLIADTNQEQSYDISPYKVSDDEDEDEDDDDDEPNSKFIPSWASKSRVALVVASQHKIDPEVVFPPKSFCSIAEVLLPRKLQQYRVS